MTIRTIQLTAPRAFLCFFGLSVCLLTVLALKEYPGQGWIYLIFAVVSNALLYSGFRKNAIFFDTFIGIFLWLGFWFKLTFRVAFMDGQFSQAVGHFDGSGHAFDHALLVTICAISAFLAVSFLREKFVFNYPKKLNRVPHQGLFQFYLNYRKPVLFGFVLLFIFVALTNSYFGIYQRGSIPRTILPFGIGGIYKWLLLFGLASFSALILHYEFFLKKRTSYMVAILALLESFSSSLSLLSRGMVLSAGALAYGVIRSWKINSLKSSFRFWVVTFSIFIILFSCSVLLVNHMRSITSLGSLKIESLGKVDSSNKIVRLVLDRWVGIEGVLAISSYPDLGWDLWREAWGEEYSNNKTSFYDMRLITSPYRNTDMMKHHYVSLPGIIAFCFYPGSFLFLFGSMFAVGVIAVVIEISIFKLGGKNVILCSLLAQVVAYRFASFGYVPKQSYLLFGSLYLNLFLIYFANKFLLVWIRKSNKFRFIKTEPD